MPETGSIFPLDLYCTMVQTRVLTLEREEITAEFRREANSHQSGEPEVRIVLAVATGRLVFAPGELYRLSVLPLHLA